MCPPSGLPEGDVTPFCRRGSHVAVDRVADDPVALDQFEDNIVEPVRWPKTCAFDAGVRDDVVAPAELGLGRSGTVRSPSTLSTR
jgi:hypothetical protein